MSVLPKPLFSFMRRDLMSLSLFSTWHISYILLVINFTSLRKEHETLRFLPLRLFQHTPPQASRSFFCDPDQEHTPSQAAPEPDPTARSEWKTALIPEKSGVLPDILHSDPPMPILLSLGFHDPGIQSLKELFPLPDRNHFPFLQSPCHTSLYSSNSQICQN